ncbi:MAG TPA: hypothetical protein DCR48_01105 [Flavobacteriales bacterium]|jgi:hypothetical protein|nr:hypothetical protein [Flavobacteriales bacterium]
MDNISAIALIITVIVTAGAIVAVVYTILNQYFKQQQENNAMQLEERKRKDFVTIQMQAYERLILFLERINPERLVFRVNKPGMSARLLQSDILKTVREEFDHNLTQQLYISSEAWLAVNAAREETFKIFNVAAERVHRDSDSLALSKSILEVSGSMEKLPTEVAIDILKREFRKKMKI